MPSFRQDWSPSSISMDQPAAEPNNGETDTTRSCYTQKRLWYAAGAVISLFLIVGLGALVQRFHKVDEVSGNITASAQVSLPALGITIQDRITSSSSRRNVLGSRRTPRQIIETTPMPSRATAPFIVLLSNSVETFDNTIEDFYDDTSRDVPDLFSDEKFESSEIFDDISIEVTDNFPSRESIEATIIIINNVTNGERQQIPVGFNTVNNQDLFPVIHINERTRSEIAITNFADINHSQGKAIENTSASESNSTFGMKVGIPQFTQNVNRANEMRISKETMKPVTTTRNKLEMNTGSQPTLNMNNMKQKVTSRNRKNMITNANTGSSTTATKSRMTNRDPSTPMSQIIRNNMFRSPTMSPTSQVFETLREFVQTDQPFNSRKEGGFTSLTRNMDDDNQRQLTIQETISNLAPQIAGIIAPDFVPGEEGFEILQVGDEERAVGAVLPNQVGLQSFFGANDPQMGIVAPTVLLVGDTDTDLSVEPDSTQMFVSRNPTQNKRNRGNVPTSIQPGSERFNSVRDNMLHVGQIQNMNNITVTGAIATSFVNMLGQHMISGISTPNSFERKNMETATTDTIINNMNEDNFILKIQKSLPLNSRRKMNSNPITNTEIQSPVTLKNPTLGDSFYEITARIPSGLVSIDLYAKNGQKTNIESIQLSPFVFKSKVNDDENEGAKSINIRPRPTSNRSKDILLRNSNRRTNNAQSVRNNRRPVAHDRNITPISEHPNIQNNHFKPNDRKLQLNRMTYHPVVTYFQPRSFTKSNTYMHGIIVKHPSFTNTLPVDNESQRLGINSYVMSNFNRLQQKKPSSRLSFPSNRKYTTPLEPFGSFQQQENVILPYPTDNSQSSISAENVDKIELSIESRQESNGVNVEDDFLKNKSKLNQLPTSFQTMSRSLPKIFEKLAVDAVNTNKHETVLGKSSHTFPPSSPSNLETNTHYLRPKTGNYIDRNYGELGHIHSFSNSNTNNDRQLKLHNKIDKQSWRISTFPGTQRSSSTQSFNLENFNWHSEQPNIFTKRSAPTRTQGSGYPIDVPSSVVSFLHSVEPSWIRDLGPK